MCLVARTRAPKFDNASDSVTLLMPHELEQRDPVRRTTTRTARRSYSSAWSSRGSPSERLKAKRELGSQVV